MDYGVAKRVREIIDNQGVSVMGFEKKINAGNNSIGTAIKRKSNINSGILNKILISYPDISPEWLLTGKGNMLRDIPIATETDDREGAIPLIPVEALAGFGSGSVYYDEQDYKYYNVPIFKGAEFMLTVRGSSMYPKYSSGDIIACKKVPLNDLFFQWGRVYVLDTEEQDVMVKRIMPHDDQKRVICKSDNEKYLPFDIPKRQIRDIAIVIGVIRLE